MEPNRFDEIVKEKLEQRTIQPREMAWDRLDAMLSVAEEKAAKPKKNRTWMFIAASFLGFLLVGTIFLKQGSNKGTEVKNTDVQVAVTPEPAINQGNTEVETETSIIDKTVQVKEEAVAAVPAKNVESKTLTPNIIQKKQRSTSASLTATAPVIVEEAVAQADKNEINPDKPTANEAETLLAAATDTDEDKRPSVKVNAKSLLSSVEGELDSSFRTKAMQAIVKNYNSVKTSVANRNHK